MRFRKKFLSILLSSALIVANLSTARISVLAEELEGATEVDTEALIATSDEELEDVEEENEPEKKKEEEVTEEITEEVTEKVSEKGTEGSTEKVTEEDSEKDSEEITEKEETHTPENITNQITQLRLNLGNAWYIDSEYGEVSLKEYDGLIDYSAISDISTVGLDVLYRLTQEGEERTVRSGDWYEITLPNVVSNVRLTGGESFGSDIAMDILDIQINGNTIKATFNQNIDDIDLSQIHGKQHIAFEVNKEVLTEETSSYMVNLQPENNCELRLPAKVSEKTDDSSAIDMEKITVVAECFSALLNDYFGDDISEEQTPEEMHEIIQNAVAEMDEEKLNECNNRTTEALDMFDSLSFEEAEYFSENESYLYNAVVVSLSEVLSTIMMGEVAPMSLLPLTEVRAYLSVSGYTDDEITAMPIDTFLGMLKDANGNSISVSESATTVWKYEIDKDGIDNYVTYEIGKGNTIDLSQYQDNQDNQIEIIVGSGHQLDDTNVRYIIKIFFSDEIEEKISFEIYNGDKNGSRVKVTPVATNYEVINWDPGIGVTIPVDSYGIVLSEGIPAGQALVNLHSERAENPHISVEVRPYWEFTDITADILNQDMTQSGTGYAVKQDTSVFVLTYFKDEILYDTKIVGVVIAGGYVDKEEYLNTADEDKTDVIFDKSVVQENDIRTTQIELKKGFSSGEEYYYSLNYYLSGRDENLNSRCKKIVLGHYDTIEEAAELPDIKDQLLGEGYKACYGGDGISFTAFFDTGIVTATGADKIVVKAIDYSQEWKEFTDAPIIGESDPWFRITGAKDISGELLDTYIIENGKNMNIDTMYGYGYQTVFISKNVDSFEPTFWLADTDAISIKSIYVNGRKFNVGETLSFPDNENILDAIFSVVISDESGRHTKNYVVRFVKRVGGPQLYVAGPLDPEIRSVFLDEYFEYKHDIFVANVGDEPLRNLRLELDASNVALDSYWTIGGEGNDTLAACPENFMVDQISTSYGELPNIAKIRLIPDGDNSGDIEGTLKIFSGSSLLATINLSGRAQNPQISTKGLEEAVKYVPYSYMITTNNMYDWNNVKLTIIDGELPLGMTFDSDTGEIYGAPLAAGEYKFTIKADFSRSDYFTPATKEFTITVLDNENATVFNTSDSGYAIIPSEDGEIGFVGEQVSAYDFVVTTFDDDDMYISEGEYDQFVKLWLNGKVLVDGVDYTKAPGSTKITIKGQTLKNKTVPGRNTISAEYNIDGERGEKLKRTSQNFRVNIKNPGSNDPTPSPTDPTPDPSDPTPGPTDPTPDPSDPTPGPTDPTPGPSDPTPGPTDPTPGPSDPTPSPTDPIPDPSDPTPGPTPGSSDPTPGPTDPTLGSTDSTQITVETISMMTINAVDANDAPLANTTIEVHSTPKTAVTDENGNASFTDVEFGTHTIYVKNEDGSIMSSKNFELVIGSNLSINGNRITAPEDSDISIKIKIDNGEIFFESVTLNSTPKTGDDTNWILYLMLLLESMLGMFITFVNMKKRRYRNKID